MVLGALLGVLSTGVVLTLAPSRRWTVTKVIIVIALVGLMARIGPPFDHLIIVMAALAMGIAFLPAHLGWLNRFQLPKITQAQASRVVEMSRPLVWNMLIPRERETHWDPAIAGIQQGLGSDRFIIVYAGRQQHDDSRVPVQVMDVDEGYSFKLRDLSPAPVAKGGSVSLTSYELEDTKNGTRVSICDDPWRQDRSCDFGRNGSR